MTERSMRSNRVSDRRLERSGARRARLVALAVLVWALAVPGGGRPIGEASAGQTGGAAAAPAGQVVSNEVYQGWKWFHVYCYRCHGTDANAGVLAPDLKASLTMLSKEDFFKTVREGRPPKGMPAWGPLLRDDQIGELYAYVKARSEGTLKEGRPVRQP